MAIADALFSPTFGDINPDEEKDRMKNVRRVVWAH